MPTIRGEPIIAAGANVANLIAGSQYEFPEFAAHIGVFAVRDGPGLPSLLFLDQVFGSIIEGDSVIVPTFTATLGPDTNRHQIFGAVTRPGRRLILRARNTDGVNAQNLRFLMKITPI